jgi:hypothetical protein
MIEAMGPAGLKGAAIYSAATVLGLESLPAGVAGLLIGKDISTHEFFANKQRVHKKLQTLLSRIGEIVRENKQTYSLKAKVSELLRLRMFKRKGLL